MRNPHGTWEIRLTFSMETVSERLDSTPSELRESTTRWIRCLTVEKYGDTQRCDCLTNLVSSSNGIAHKKPPKRHKRKHIKYPDARMQTTVEADVKFLDRELSCGHGSRYHRARIADIRDDRPMVVRVR
jgi:hypothetical protein